MEIINSKLLINMLIKHDLIMPFYRTCFFVFVHGHRVANVRVCVCLSDNKAFNLDLCFSSLILRQSKANT